MPKTHHYLNFPDVLRVKGISVGGWDPGTNMKEMGRTNLTAQEVLTGCISAYWGPCFPSIQHVRELFLCYRGKLRPEGSY